MPAPVASRLKERLDSDFEVVGIDAVGQPDDPAAVGKALEVYERACRPADHQTLAYEVGAMRLSVAVPSMAEEDIDAQATIYARRLAEWPGDAALAALRDWPSKSRWWPAWHELEQIVRSHCGERIMRRDALRRMHDGEASPERDRRTVGNVTYADPQAADNRRRVRGAEMADLGGLADRLRAGIERDGTQEAD